MKTIHLKRNYSLILNRSFHTHYKIFRKINKRSKNESIFLFLILKSRSMIETLSSLVIRSWLNFASFFDAHDLINKIMLSLCIFFFFWNFKHLDSWIPKVIWNSFLRLGQYYRNSIAKFIEKRKNIHSYHKWSSIFLLSKVQTADFDLDKVFFQKIKHCSWKMMKMRWSNASNHRSLLRKSIMSWNPLRILKKNYTVCHR